MTTNECRVARLERIRGVIGATAHTYTVKQLAKDETARTAMNKNVMYTENI